MTMRFCDCKHSFLGNKRTQVLHAGLYPTSVSDPQSCATFQVLEEFHLLNLTGGLNMHDFIGTLEHRTDATGIILTPVSSLYRTGIYISHRH